MTTHITVAGTTHLPSLIFYSIPICSSKSDWSVLMCVMVSVSVVWTGWLISYNCHYPILAASLLPGTRLAPVTMMGVQVSFSAGHCLTAVPLLSHCPNINLGIIPLLHHHHHNLMVTMVKLNIKYKTFIFH